VGRWWSAGGGEFARGLIRTLVYITISKVGGKCLRRQYLTPHRHCRETGNDFETKTFDILFSRVSNGGVERYPFSSRPMKHLSLVQSHDEWRRCTCSPITVGRETIEGEVVSLKLLKRK
jgi:hypothetical protein